MQEFSTTCQKEKKKFFWGAYECNAFALKVIFEMKHTL
jgi:hypothetical protein